MTLLNIGCGALAPEGWLNIDASPALRASKVPLLGRLVRLDPEHIAPNAVYRDIVAGPPLEPRSCDLIFASHVLEHLSLADAHIMLDRVFVALRYGGIFRVIVPDLDAYVRDYILNPGAGAASAFMTRSGIGATRSRVGLRARMREALSNARHQWMWTGASLQREMEAFPRMHVTVRCGHEDVGDQRFLAVEQAKRHVNAVCLEAKKVTR